MSVQITVRNVPVEVRDSLATRAARKGQSMQEYLRCELEALVARPATEELVERIRQRKARHATALDPDDILAARDANRR
jgi:plasmid stability protein